MERAQKFEGTQEEWDALVKKNSELANKIQFDFGIALKILKEGQMVQRIGWNGKGIFIFLRPADELNVEFVVDKVKSLPQRLKAYYLLDIINENGERVPVAEDDTVKFTAYFCLKSADGTIVNGWLPSQTDLLAEDWIAFE